MILNKDLKIVEYESLTEHLIMEKNSIQLVDNIVENFNYAYEEFSISCDSNILKEGVSDLFSDFISLLERFKDNILEMIRKGFEWIKHICKSVDIAEKTFPDGFAFDPFMYGGFEFNNTFDTSLLDDLNFFGHQNIMTRMRNDLDRLSKATKEISITPYEQFMHPEIKNSVKPYFKSVNKKKIKIDPDMYHEMVKNRVEYKKFIKDVRQDEKEIKKELNEIIAIVKDKVKDLSSDINQSSDKTLINVTKKWNVMLSNITAYMTHVEFVIATKINCMRDEVLQTKEIQALVLKKIKV